MGSTKDLNPESLIDLSRTAYFFKLNLHDDTKLNIETAPLVSDRYNQGLLVGIFKGKKIYGNSTKHH